MKTKKQRTKKSGMPPGKAKAPKPRSVTGPAKPADHDKTTLEPGEQKTPDQVIAPDGEPQPKKEPEPLF